MPRPKKVTEPKEPKVENPDKQVATRGYVKCIARKISDKGNFNFYYNESDTKGVASMIVGIIAFMIWLVAVGIGHQDPYITWAFGIVWFMCLVSFIDHQIMPDIKSRQKDFPAYLKKYIPPSEDCESDCKY